MAGDGTATFVHADQLGSVRALTDGAGTVVGTFAWDAYGNPTGSTGAVSLPFGFAGEYRDAESGMVYLRARYYDPSTGQLVSVDPAFLETASRYGYVAGDPLNRVDPAGLAPEFTRYGAAPRPAGMSEADYRSYRNIVDGLNRQTCEDLALYMEQVARAGKRRALEARIASLQEWKRTAAIENSKGSFVGDMIRNPEFDVNVLLNVAYAGVGCLSHIPYGSAAGAVVGAQVTTHPVGSAIGAVAGGVAGCAVGAVDATYTSSSINLS